MADAVACVPPAGFEPATSVKRALSMRAIRAICRLVAGASQLVSRFDGIHVIFSLVAMALRFATTFAYWDDGVYRAFHATA